MKIYIMENGERVKARTARDLLRQLRARAWVPFKTHRAWMLECRRRVYQTTHQRLNIDSEAKFVAGLVASGLLRKEEEKGK